MPKIKLFLLQQLDFLKLKCILQQKPWSKKNLQSIDQEEFSKESPKHYKYHGPQRMQSTSSREKKRIAWAFERNNPVTGNMVRCNAFELRPPKALLAMSPPKRSG